MDFPMLVYLHRYREADADEAARSDKSSDVDMDAQSYFATDDLALDEWEQFEYRDMKMLRKVETHDDVTAVSVPKDHLDEHEVPGDTIQLRMADGETEYVENATIIEASDAEP